MRLALLFAWFGSFWGSFAVATFELERFLRVGDAGFGAIISAAVAFGICANLGGPFLARRWGARRALVAAVAGWSLIVLGLAAAPLPVLFGVLFVLGLGVSGLVDLGINVAGTARFRGRPGDLARLHAFFNAGAITGAVVMAGLLAAGISWRWTWVAVGLAGLPLALAARSDPQALFEAGEDGGPVSPLVLWRARLLLLALAFALATLIEGGTDTWGVLYLRAHLALSALAGGAGYAAGQVLAVSARIWIGPRAGARGGALGAAIGAGVAAVGLVVEAAAPGQLAPAGLALAVLGVSLCWPLLMSAAGMAGGNLPAIVGALVAVAYSGFLVGPSAIGWISGAAGLRTGLFTLAALAAVSAAAAALHHARARLT